MKNVNTTELDALKFEIKQLKEAQQKISQQSGQKSSNKLLSQNDLSANARSDNMYNQPNNNTAKITIVLAKAAADDLTRPDPTAVYSGWITTML